MSKSSKSASLRLRMRGAVRFGVATTAGVVAVLGVWTSLGPALSQDQGSVCSTRDDLRQILLRSFGETPVAGGIVNEDIIVELFVEADGATWSIVVSGADGQSCVLSAGTEWQSHAPPMPPNQSLAAVKDR